VFEVFYVDKQADEPQEGAQVAHAPLTPVIQAVLAQRPTTQGQQERTPEELSLPEGSILINLAVTEGFEPSVDLHPQTLSRRSP
jgi:hypothetical protein